MRKVLPYLISLLILALLLFGGWIFFNSYEITPTIATQIDSFVAEDRPVPPTVIDVLTSGDANPVTDTTITCNDSTNICTCQSTSNGDCGPKLRALCEDVVDWSDGGVGEGCPTVDDTE